MSIFIKKLVLLFLITGLTSLCFSQNKVVDYISSDKLHNYSDAQRCEIVEVPGKGVLVSYSTIKTKGGFSYGPSLAFFDKDLNKKWELIDYSPSEMSKAYFGTYYGYANRFQEQGKLRISNCYVDPSGAFAYTINTNQNTINIIEIATGKLNKINLENKIHLNKGGFPEYSVDAFVDDKYFYLVEGNNYQVPKDAKRRPSVFVHRIKHGNSKSETFTLNPKRPSGDSEPEWGIKFSEMRQWKNFLVLNNVAIFIDNFTVEDKKSKQFYRKLAYYPLDGSDHTEIFVKMGEKIADNDLLGEIMYDKVHQRIFTYSMNKDNGRLVLTYRCFNLKMELVWEKNFDPQLGKQIIQKIINPAVLSINYDNSVTITSRYGKDHYYVHTDVNGDNPEFKKAEKCTQGKLIENSGYTVNCHEFNNLQKAKGFKSFILKDKNAKENKFVDEVDIFKVGDKVIFGKSLYRRPGYKLASFDLQ